MIEYLTRFLLLFTIILLIGFGPALFLKGALKIKSIFLLFIYSIVMGLMINVFTLLVVGMLGYEILGSNYDIIIISLILLSLVLLFIGTIKNGWSVKSLKNVPIWEKGSVNIDYLAYAILLILFLYMFISNAKMYLYQTDELRFWLVDAKIIFQSNALRIDSKTISNNAYSSFMPIHFAQIYHIFGRVVEQYAAVISMIYLSLGSFLTYISVNRYSKNVKILTLLTIIVVNFILAQQAFFAYADITLSFYVLLSVVLITNRVEKKDYPKKVFILLMAIFATAFVKFPVLQFSPYSILIFICWLLYDRKVMIDYFRSVHAKNIGNIILLLTPLIILISNWYYRSTILEKIDFYGGENPSVIARFTDFFTSSDQMHIFSYPSFVFEYMWDIHRPLLILLLTLWIVTIVYFITVYRKEGGIKGVLKQRKALLYSVLVFLFPLMNLVFYALIHRRSQIERYLGVSIFVAVLLYAQIFRSVYFKKYMKLFMLLFVILIIYMVPTSYLSRKAIFISGATGGSYSDFERFKEKSEIAEDVKSIIGDDDIVIGRYQLHCQSKEIDCVLNTTNNVNVYKYFLQENQNGKYFSVSTDEFVDYMFDGGYEYLLVSVGFAFTEKFETEGSYDKFVHLYEFDREERTFEYIKGYEDYEYIE